MKLKNALKLKVGDNIYLKESSKRHLSGEVVRVAPRLDECDAEIVYSGKVNIVSLTSDNIREDFITVSIGDIRKVREGDK